MKVCLVLRPSLPIDIFIGIERASDALRYSIAIGSFAMALATGVLEFCAQLDIAVLRRVEIQTFIF
jgi:hypothetical protein